MNKHTLGTWHSEKEGINKFVVCNGVDIAEVFEKLSPEESHYNVMLIAAAPDLLEALKKAVKEMEGLPHSLGYEFTDLPAMRAAIAKATGEST